jgi:tetratricopeptide (TPR) repeat protein
MHLTNLLLHTANSIILFLLLRAMTTQLWRPAFVAAFFAWHPMHVESVAWISERKDVLSSLFFLLTIAAYWRYTLLRGARRAPLFYGLAILLFALGLMAKPMLVTLPFVLLLLDFWPLHRFDDAKPLSMRLGSLCAEKIPFFILSFASCAMTLVAQARGGAIAPLPLSVRFLNAFVAYAQYINKLIWPSGLCVIYPYNPNITFTAAWWPLILIPGLCAMTLAFCRKQPWLAVGCFWFLGMLVPVIGLVQVGGQAIADRYTYLPSIGFFIAACWFVGNLVAATTAARISVLALGASALIGCLLTARAQVFSWRDGGALFRRAIEVAPNNFIAHSSYAAYLLLVGDWNQAARECQTALQLNPYYAPAREYLGYAEFKQGRLQEAAADLQKGLQLDPHKHDVNLQLGEVYLAQHLPDRAEEQYRIYLAYDPADPAAHFGLGKALAARGKWDEAREAFAAVAKLPIPFPDAHAQWALALAKTGRIAEAIDQYHAALRADTSHLEALNNLAWIRAANSDPKFRDGSEAVLLAQRACALTGYAQPMIIGTLAAAYAEAGQFDDAVAAAQRAHDVAAAQTNDIVASRNLQLMELYKSHQAYHER